MEGWKEEKERRYGRRKEGRGKVREGKEDEDRRGGTGGEKKEERGGRGEERRGAVTYKQYMTTSDDVNESISSSSADFMPESLRNRRADFIRKLFPAVVKPHLGYYAIQLWCFYHEQEG